MKKPRLKKNQAFQILKVGGADVPVPELCRKHGMRNASFLNGQPSTASSTRRI